MLPLSTPRPAVRAQDEGGDLPLPVAAFGAHPRLLITQAYVNQTLKPRAAAGAESWATLAAYAASRPTRRSDGNGLPTRRCAPWRWRGWLRRTAPTPNARRPSWSASSTASRTHPAMASNGGFDGAFMEDVAALAVGYDWLYHALSEDDRAPLRETLWRAAKRLRNPATDTGRRDLDRRAVEAFGNYEPRWLWALTAIGTGAVGRARRRRDTARILPPDVFRDDDPRAGSSGGRRVGRRAGLRLYRQLAEGPDRAGVVDGGGRKLF